MIVAFRMGHKARACGSSSGALIPLSVNLINWENHIIFMSQDNFIDAMKYFKISEVDEDIRPKAIVWGIPDIYDWGDNILFNIVREKLNILQNEGKL